MGQTAIIFVIDVFVCCLCVWVAGKCSFVKLQFSTVLGIVSIVGVISLIPYIGWISGLILFVLLLVKIADCAPLDAVWVVIFSKLFTIITLVAFQYFSVYEKLFSVIA